MKGHERKAILRALEPATKQVRAEYQREILSPKMLRHIALRTVTIAQLRAGRLYDNVTADKARTYAYHKACELIH